MKHEKHTTTLRERRQNRAESLSFGRTATELKQREKKFKRQQKRAIQSFRRNNI